MKSWKVLFHVSCHSVCDLNFGLKSGGFVKSSSALICSFLWNAVQLSLPLYLLCKMNTCHPSLLAQCYSWFQFTWKNPINTDYDFLWYLIKCLLLTTEDSLQVRVFTNTNNWHQKTKNKKLAAKFYYQWALNWGLVLLQSNALFSELT